MVIPDHQRKILCYTLWITLLIGFTIGGFLLYVGSIVNYPYSGTILYVECSVCEGLTCFQTIYIDVNYVVNNTNQTAIYETVSFPNCEPDPLYYWEEQCCSNLIGTKVYFELSNEIPNSITKLSLTDKDRKTIRYIFSIILFSLGPISCFTSICITSFCEERYFTKRRNYINIGN